MIECSTHEARLRQQLTQSYAPSVVLHCDVPADDGDSMTMLIDALPKLTTLTLLRLGKLINTPSQRYLWGEVLRVPREGCTWRARMTDKALP